jgi:hypothetical protein
MSIMAIHLAPQDAQLPVSSDKPTAGKDYPATWGDFEDWFASEEACLVDTSRREHPESGNLYRAVEYDRTAWEGVRQGLDRWGRRSGR